MMSRPSSIDAAPGQAPAERTRAFASAALELWADLGGQATGDSAAVRAPSGRIAAAIAWRVRAVRAVVGGIMRAAARRASGWRSWWCDVASRERAAGWPDVPPDALPWRAGTPGQPLVSVVIPTCNRYRDLARALAAWADQRPVELCFEVVVVDDGSRDRTAELLAGWHSDRYLLRTMRQENLGPAAARNHALEHARAPLVLFTGDDIEPTPDLLAEHLRAHAACDDPGTAVLGRIEWPPAAPLTATMRHIDGPGSQQFSFRYMADGCEYDFRHFYTSNVSVRRQLLDRVPDGFSCAFPAAAFEDADLAWRMVPHGLRIVYRRSALAFHHHHYDAPGFYARQVRCGRMAWVLYRRFPELADHLSIAELAEYHALATATPPVSPAGVEMLETRMLGLAAAADELPPEVADPLLLAVFRCGVLRGLALAAYDGAIADRVAHVALCDLLPPALAAAAAAAQHPRDES